MHTSNGRSTGKRDSVRPGTTSHRRPKPFSLGMKTPKGILGNGHKYIHRYKKYILGTLYFGETINSERELAGEAVIA
jgi:hypothetical protein